eukprot:353350-Chlamydomonas_euryale.AAC.10
MSTSRRRSHCNGLPCTPCMNRSVSRKRRVTPPRQVSPNDDGSPMPPAAGCAAAARGRHAAQSRGAHGQVAHPVAAARSSSARASLPLPPPPPPGAAGPLRTDATDIDRGRDIWVVSLVSSFPGFAASATKQPARSGAKRRGGSPAARVH